MLLKTFKILIIFLIAYLLGGHLYYYFTGDFREGNILREAPISTKTYKVPQGLDEILNQTFTFFAHGNQTFAFVNEDQTYVLKLFKKETLERSWVNNFIPPVFPFKQFLIRTGDENETKMKRIFVGYEAAYDRNRENYGLVYVRLNPNQLFNKTIQIKDPFGMNREVSLDDAIFVVQVKAKTTRQVLQELLDKGRVDEAMGKIDKIYQLYEDEYARGLVDQDHNVMDNTGFVGEKAIRIDVGKLTVDEKVHDASYREKDRKKVDKRFRLWIEKYYPEYFPRIQLRSKGIMDQDAVLKQLIEKRPEIDSLADIYTLKFKDGAEIKETEGFEGLIRNYQTILAASLAWS